MFIQNGMLQPWLDAQGLGENTQVGVRVKRKVGVGAGGNGGAAK